MVQNASMSVSVPDLAAGVIAGVHVDVEATRPDAPGREPGRSALVEETAVGDRGGLSLVGGDLDVSRRQEEHLGGDALDRAVEPEDQTGREVDETLGVGVVNVTEVNDDRHLIAEPFADVL